MIQVRYFLKLNGEGTIEAPQDKIIYIYQNTAVQIQLQNRKQGKYPILIERKDYKKISEDFTKNTDLKLLQNTHKVSNFELNESGDWMVNTIFKNAGSAYLRVIWLDQNHQIDNLGEPNYIIVQPQIVDRLNQLTIQTLLPYCLDKFEHFEEQIKSQVQLGYDAFHLPPIQQLGSSPSLYAIGNQLELNKDIFGKSKYEDLQNLMKKFPEQLFFIDILLNHTAYDSEWLNKPGFEMACYTSQNSPHLEVAIRLDCAICEFSNMLGKGKITSYPKNRIENEDDLNQVIRILEYDVIRTLNLHEYFLFDVEQVIKKIDTECKLVDLKTEQEEDDENIFIDSPGQVLQKLITEHTILKGAQRFGVQLNYEEINSFLKKPSNKKHLSKEYLRELLTHFNTQFHNEAEQYIQQAINSTRGQIRYSKLELGNYEVVSNEKGDSLVPRYFTLLKNGQYAANNGWIQGFDPLLNFAETLDHHYFRRSIIIWGDLIKLRYGNSKADCPALWKFMKQYVQQMAKIFHGLRLDNAHSTSLVAGEYMMRKAKKINPNLLIFAELFTGSAEKDSVFTKRLSINCLVRETNRCNDSGQLNRELHYYSGQGLHAIGSLPHILEQFKGQDDQYTLLLPQFTPALIYEQSHDNESLISSHGYKHQLPISALISFSSCMGGTVRGYDIYLQHRLSVVDERRIYPIVGDNGIIQELEQSTVSFRVDWATGCKIELYGSWSNWKIFDVIPETHPGIYIISLRLNVGQHQYKYKINEQWLTVPDKQINEEGNHYFEITKQRLAIYSTMEKVRQILGQEKKKLVNYPYIFTQVHGTSVQSILRESHDHTESKILIASPCFGQPDQNTIIQLPGIISSVDLIAYNGDNITYHDDKQKLIASETQIFSHNNIQEFADLYFNEKTKCHYLKFIKIPQSFVCIISCKQYTGFHQNLKQIHKLLHANNNNKFQGLTSSQICYLLYMSGQEEQDLNQLGLYHVSNYRDLIYAGYAGARSALREAQKYNNLGHPICENLRNGNWLIDYLNNRVQRRIKHNELELLIQQISDCLKSIPRHQIPQYFTKYVEFIYQGCMSAVAPNCQSQFQRELKLASYQFLADIPSAKLMSAGLPHFTTGWTRCWGRDTFIAFKGIYLENKLFKEAKEAILIFGSTLRNGLIPNLLDSCNSPRYNCRDACWWYIKAIKDYIQFTKSADILNEKVNMVFTDDDQERHLHNLTQQIVLTKSIAEIVQKIFQDHAQGIRFREWNAGDKIDQNMQSEGFNISLELDEETGFIVGGNWLNCLTWMDKMGSSEHAGNKGIPATSRDGAPIELTALLKVCVDFVAQLHSKKQYPFEGITLKNQKLSFKEWSSLITKNFEKYYWVPAQNTGEYQIVDKHVRHKSIYKDLCKSSKPRNEYQLRCNASIAIGLAPELFHKEHAMLHLAAVEAYLIKPNSLGIKTLDPQASEYLSYYDNSDQSNVFNLAQGFSYHNGPEWVWVYGYFLKALHLIHGKNSIHKQLFYSYLVNHKETLHNNEWYSLPEMTNGDNEYNVYSCRAQAWSISCILEAVVDYESEQ